MNYKPFGSTGVQVSELCFGTMLFGGDCDEEMSAAIFHRCREAGINFFDCADVYVKGRAEEVLGRLIADCRDEVVITSKAVGRTGAEPNARGASRRHLMRAVERSLKRLGTDRIDVYFLHHFDSATPIEEMLRALDDLVTQGKILYPAASNWAAWQTAKALGLSARESWAPFACIQPMYSLVKRQAEVEVLPMALAEGLAVIPYSPTAGGLLSGKYAAGRRPEQGRHLSNEMYQRRYREPWMFEAAERLAALAAERGVHPVSLAVAWVSHHPAVTAPIVSARTLEQLEPALSSVDIGMTPELYAELSALTPTPPPAHDRSDEVETPEADTADTLRDSARRPHRFR
ncbi:MAG: aldo/keto reductase [SAR324 cluster bacterium]|nr:aldo/keto reductase [SAR324 cluster bacterium]